MSEELERRSSVLKAWMLMHRTRDLAFYLQDRICREYGITLEQYRVLVAMKCLDDPVTVGDVARWTGDELATASQLADRVFQAGLLDRFRDLPDRRKLRLTITDKGERALEQATPDIWRFIEASMSALSAEETTTLVNLLEKVRGSELQGYTPKNDMRTSGSYETSDLSRLVKRLGKYARRSRSLP